MHHYTESNELQNRPCTDTLALHNIDLSRLQLTLVVIGCKASLQEVISQTHYVTLKQASQYKYR